MQQPHIAALDDILYRVRVYREAPRVRADVLDLLRQYPSLYPVQGVLQPGGGPLLHLVGTIPIMYGGVQYNIPVKIWIPDTYPYAPPFVYVSPTADMIIAPRHKHVDNSGMVYLPFLNMWSGSSSLLALTTILSRTFSEDPPVRSQPAGARPAASAHRPLPAQPPQPQPPTSQPPPYPYGQTDYYSQPPPQQHVTEDPAVVMRRNALDNGTTKLQNSLREFYQATTKEIDGLMRQSSELNTRNATLEQEREATLRALEQAELELAQIDSLTLNVMQFISENENANTKVDIDLHTNPRDSLSMQLLQLVAEDATIEDVLYQLDRSAGSGNIPLDEYLKQVCPV
eukprot:TRINITY_DN8391_c0_g1_i2.p1 TRINITY_DN8391_c0_g1~~TRINITY_DN8391_c0_g1_i2.p1  ORF type:complete len:358 (-),score=88.97 TRINITY_DN8391_c0_g1_i2:316-1341(-)